MPKLGVRADYDLRANDEPTAKNNTCELCGASPAQYQWTDLYGEAMCVRCGCPYQLKGGTEAQEEEGNYPYLNLSDSFLPVAREYWQKTKKFVCYGHVIVGHRQGVAEFVSWLKECHPEWL